MKKIFSFGIVCLMFIGLLSTSIALGEQIRTHPGMDSTISNNDELDQSQTVYINGIVVPVGRISIFENTFTLLVAQSFVPTKEVLTRVELLVGKNATARYPLKVGIRDNLSHQNLVETQFEPDQISTGNLTWTEFNFEDLWVTPGQTYYIVSSTKNATDNFYGWAANNHSDSYPNGVAFWSIDNGSSWHQSASMMQPQTNPAPQGPRSRGADNGTYDMCFKTYGLKKTVLSLTVTSTFIKPTFSIKNTGNVTAQNLTWQGSVQGGIFKKVNYTFSGSGSQSDLKPGDSFLVKFGMVTGFGPITVTMSASAINAKQVTITRNGFVFLFFIILQK